MTDLTQTLGREEPPEQEIEWEPTQEESVPAAQPAVEEEPEESMEWEASPARPPRVGIVVILAAMTMLIVGNASYFG